MSDALLCPPLAGNHRQMKHINMTTRKAFCLQRLDLQKVEHLCIFRKIVTINFVSSWYIFTTSGVVYFCPHKKLWTICPFHSESELISVPRREPEFGWIKIAWAFVSRGFSRLLNILSIQWSEGGRLTFWSIDKVWKSFHRLDIAILWNVFTILSPFYHCCKKILHAIIAMYGPY